MKRTLLPAILTAVLGFAAGWFLKPAPPLPATAFSSKSQQKRQATPPAPTVNTNFSEPESAAQSLPVPPVTRAAEPAKSVVDPTAAATSRDAAKLSRLVEALNLNQQQQDDLLKIITNAQAAVIPTGAGIIEPGQIIPNAAATGAAIEKALAALLSPEQAAAFEALRQRSRENSVEAAAQTQLTDQLKGIDLTPEQRQQALDRLRQSAAAQLASRPASLDLALDSSVLPTGPEALHAESLESVQNLADYAGDPAKAQQTIIDRNRANLDSQLDLYQGILTPAQQAQLKSEIQERHKTVDRLSEILK